MVTVEVPLYFLDQIFFSRLHQLPIISHNRTHLLTSPLPNRHPCLPAGRDDALKKVCSCRGLHRKRKEKLLCLGYSPFFVKRHLSGGRKRSATFELFSSFLERHPEQWTCGGKRERRIPFDTRRPKIEVVRTLIQWDPSFPPAPRRASLRMTL